MAGFSRADVAQTLLDFGRQFRTLHVVFGPELVVTHNRFVETRSVVLPVSRTANPSLRSG
jgi:hypothetical protein